MKILSKILFLLLFIANCTKSNSGDLAVDKKPKEINADISISHSYEELDLFEKFEVFNISLPKGKLMGNVYKFLFSNNTIGIYDEINTTVWLFDQNFNYKKSLKLVLGQGPNEFYEVNDVVLGPDNSVFVLGVKKLLEFDNDGNVLRKIDLPIIARRFDYLSEKDLFVFYLNNRNVSKDFGPYNILIFNSDGKLLKKDLPIPKFKEGLALYQPSNFYHYENKLHVYGYLNFNIYTLNKNLQLSKKYEFSFDKYQISDEVLAKKRSYDSINEFNKNELANFVRLIPSIMETDRYVFINMVFQKKPGTVLYDKKNEKTFYTPEIFSGAENKLGFFFKAAHKNKIYASTSPGKLINFYEKHPNLNRNKLNGYEVNNLDSLISLSDEFSNPFIIRATVKD